MTTTTANPQERIAREHLGTDCFYIGQTVDGTAYYWSTRRQRLLAVDTEGDTDTLDLAPDKSFGELIRTIGRERGWATEPRVSKSLLTDLNQAVTG